MIAVRELKICHVEELILWINWGRGIGRKFHMVEQVVASGTNDEQRLGKKFISCLRTYQLCQISPDCRKLLDLVSEWNNLDLQLIATTQIMKEIFIISTSRLISFR